MLRRTVFACFILSITALSLYAQPRIRVEPEISYDTLAADEVVEHEFVISNIGDENLEIDVELMYDREMPRGPGRELIGSFQGNNAENQYSSCIGYDPENGWMWVSNYSSATVAAYSYEVGEEVYFNFEETARLQNPGNCMDGTVINGMVYIGEWSASRCRG